MSTRKLNRTEWRGYFDAASKKLGASQVQVLIGGPDLGLQPELRGLPLLGITFDTHDDALEIATEMIEHRIFHPKTIVVEEDAKGRLEAIEVSDTRDQKTIVQLEPALVVHGA